MILITAQLLSVHVLWLTESHGTRLTITVWHFHLNFAIPIPNVLWVPHSHFSTVMPFQVIMLIIYKQQFLHSDWLRACQLIPNQCKKVKLSAKSWNWVQKSEIECKTMKLKWLTAPTLSSDKQNGGQKLNEGWNSLSKVQHNYLITKQSAKLNNNY